MIYVKAKVKMNKKAVPKALKRGEVKTLGQAGAYIRGIARKSIKVSPEKSEPGKPPHSRKGQIKRAILFGVEKAAGTVVIGPSESGVGLIGHTHEFGGKEKPKKTKARKPNWKLEVGGHGPVRTGAEGTGFAKLKTMRQVERAKEKAKTFPPSQAKEEKAATREYPPRPFMGPALERSKERLPKFWANSVRGG